MSKIHSQKEVNVARGKALNERRLLPIESPWNPQLTRIYCVWPRLSRHERDSVVTFVEDRLKKRKRTAISRKEK
jgi:hypothetical protein